MERDKRKRTIQYGCFVSASWRNVSRLLMPDGVYVGERLSQFRTSDDGLGGRGGAGHGPMLAAYSSSWLRVLVPIACGEVRSLRRNLSAPKWILSFQLPCTAMGHLILLH